MVTPPNDDHLVVMLAAQRELQIESYNLDPAELTDPQARAEFIRWNMLALVAEAMEALEEAPTWKPWSTSTEVNEDRFLNELVDLWHFMMNLMWVTYGQGVLGDAYVLADVFTEKYFAKREKNAQRQRDGYDGVSSKCPNCRRALDDVGFEFLEAHDPVTNKVVIKARWCRGCGYSLLDADAAR